MYEKIKSKVIAKYGSINKLAKALGIESGDLYSAFAGTKPMFKGYKLKIAEALNEDVDKLFGEVTKDE